MNTLTVVRSALKTALPFADPLRRLKRRISPYQDDPNNNASCLWDGLQQIAALRSTGVPLTGDVLEFGTGWLPIIPFLFHVAGAKSLTLTDIERLMDYSTVAKARSIVADAADKVATALGLTEQDVLERLARPFAPDYLVPWRPEDHPHASADLIISRACFEHVPEAALRGFLTQFHRILRTDGVMCHAIDNSDHWEHKDKSLCRVEFLRHEDGLLWWAAGLNPQSFTNRLRHSDYRSLFAAAGFDVLHEEGKPDPDSLRVLERLPLAARFRSYAPEDLAILTSLFVVRRHHVGDALSAKPLA